MPLIGGGIVCFSVLHPIPHLISPAFRHLGVCRPADLTAAEDRTLVWARRFMQVLRRATVLMALVAATQGVFRTTPEPGN